MSSEKIKLLTLCTLIIGFLVTIVQICAWPDAGKIKQDKAYEYDFQLNYWNEDIHKKFNNLRVSEVTPRLVSFKGKKVVNLKLFHDINEYHFLIKELLRGLEFKSKVSINLLYDIKKLEDKGLKHISEPIKLSKDIKQFDNLLQEFDKREKRLKIFLPELVSSFKYEEETNVDKKIELTNKQLDLIKELFTDEALFITKTVDPFTFVRDLGNSSYTMLDNYKNILAGYNKEVSIEESYKNILLIFLALLSIYFSALIVIKSEDNMVDYEVSVNNIPFRIKIKS